MKNIPETKGKSFPENSGRNQDGTFKKGVSGHPEGKPPGTRNFSTDFDEAVKKIADANNISVSEARMVLIREAYVQAKGGSFPFYQDIIDRLYGSSSKNINVGGQEKNPIKVVILEEMQEDETVQDPAPSD